MRNRGATFESMWEQALEAEGTDRRRPGMPDWGEGDRDVQRVLIYCGGLGKSVCV